MIGPFTAVAAGRVGNSQYVVGQAGPQAVAWYSPDGNVWQEPQALDPTPQLAVEVPRATCGAGNSAVVVGTQSTTQRGSRPAAWSSTDGTNWTTATFSSQLPAGSYSELDFCLSTGSSFIGFGGSTGAAQALSPALWSSTDGSSWQPLPATFAGPTGGPPLGPETAPLDSVATGTTTWMGVSGDGDGPDQVWPAPVGGAAGAVFTPVGLWSSVNAGSSWQQLSTGSAPFAGNVFAQAVAAAYVGQQPVVAGTVDGQLAVWVGTPSSAPPTT